MCRDVAKVVFPPSKFMVVRAVLRLRHLVGSRAGGPANHYTFIDRTTEHSNERGLRFWIRHGMLGANSTAMVVALRDGSRHVRTFTRDP